MRAFYFKHNRITLGCRTGENIIEFSCGCEIDVKNIKKHEVIQKTKYFLNDGREIVKIPSEELRYELK